VTRPAPYVPESQLPEGAVIQQLRDSGETFAEIGERYGVTRQAVHKALKTWHRRIAASAK
jgi:uncharacterized protein (DUF433 family)